MKINFVSGKEYMKDSTTVYDVSNGDRTFSMPISLKSNFSMQCKWTTLDAVDGTLKIYGSNDNVNWDLLPSKSSETMVSASSSFTFIKDEFNWDYMALVFTANAVTSGSLKLTLTIKE